MRNRKRAIQQRHRRRVQYLLSNWPVDSGQGRREGEGRRRAKEPVWEKDGWPEYGHLPPAPRRSYGPAGMEGFGREEQKGDERDPRPRRYVLQIVFSLFLLAGLYLIQGSSSPWGMKAKAWTEQAFSESINFERVAFWYESRFGQAPSFLPTFTPQPPGGVSVTTPRASGGFIPVAGQVLRPFSPQHQGVLLQLASGESVRAAMEGWVVFAGEREGMGQTVILQHAGGLTTWYAQLSQVAVAKDDWVQSGQVLGAPSLAEGEEPHFFFALQHAGTFVNPEVPLDAQ